MIESTLKESLDEYWKQSARTKEVVQNIMSRHGHGDKQISGDRPYPEGTAWDEAWRQRRRAERLQSILTHVYNSGYHAGHHYTVEGGYVDIRSSDMDSYHEDDVKELVGQLLEKWDE